MKPARSSDEVQGESRHDDGGDSNPDQRKHLRLPLAVYSDMLHCSASCYMAQGVVNDKMLNIRLPESEFLLLTRFAAAAGRTKTDVVRELIRGLRQEMAREAKPPKKPRPKS